MIYNRPKMCILSASPLTLQSFLLDHILKLSESFDIVLAYNPKYDGKLNILNLPVREFYLPIERKISLVRDLAAFFNLYYFFKVEKFDIVISVVPKAGLLGMVASFLTFVPKRVHIFQGEVWSSKRGLMRLFLKTMDGLTSRFSTHLLAVSQSQLTFLEQEGVVPKGKAKILGLGSICGVDFDRFKPNPYLRVSLRNSLGIPEDASVCIFLGRLAVDKGIFDLVKAFVMAAVLNSNIWLLIVGADEENLESEILNLIPINIKLKVHFLGFSPNPESILAACDFLCLPSYREGFGMVIIEAAAMGLPTIGTKIHGISDAIVDGLTGRLVPVGNVVTLANEILLWCSNQNMRSAYSIAGRDRVHQFFDKKMVVCLYVDYFLELFSINNTKRSYEKII